MATGSSAELVEVLDRQYQYLMRQEGADFLRQVVRYVEFLTEDAQVGCLAAELKDEARRLVADHCVHDEKLVHDLVRLRTELGEYLPDCDESAMDSPLKPTDVTVERELRELRSFARFDEIAGRQGDPPSWTLLWPSGTMDQTRSAELLQILRWKVDAQADARKARSEEIADSRKRLKLLEHRHQHVHRKFVNDKGTLAGVALLGLSQACEKANPSPNGPDEDAALIWPKDIAPFNNHWAGPIHEFLYHAGRKDLDARGRRVVDTTILECRKWVDCVHEELRLRIGTRASRRAVFNRFKVRCEWYRREQLRDLVSDPKRREKTLVVDLALYLFDQGFFPITEFPVTDLRSDLLDVSSKPPVLVAAKQYSKGNPTRQIREGFQQLLDEVGRTEGTDFEVGEAFYAVFRLGGGRVCLPDVVKIGGCVVHNTVIDIAPTSVSGCRQRHSATTITEEELLRPTKSHRRRKPS